MLIKLSIGTSQGVNAVPKEARKSFVLIPITEDTLYVFIIFRACPRFISVAMINTLTKRNLGGEWGLFELTVPSFNPSVEESQRQEFGPVDHITP